MLTSILAASFHDSTLLPIKHCNEFPLVACMKCIRVYLLLVLQFLHTPTVFSDRKKSDLDNDNLCVMVICIFSCKGTVTVIYNCKSVLTHLDWQG